MFEKILLIHTQNYNIQYGLYICIMIYGSFIWRKNRLYIFNKINNGKSFKINKLNDINSIFYEFGFGEFEIYCIVTLWYIKNYI